MNKNQSQNDSTSKKYVFVLKTDDSESAIDDNSEHSEVFEKSEKHIDELCKSLLSDSKDYNPSVTVGKISEYVKEKENQRILYSKISRFVFDLETDNQEGIFQTNIEKLVDYAFNDGSGLNQDVIDEIVKIYDHSLLAIYQKHTVKNHIRSSLEKTKEKIKTEITESVTEDVKKYEKEYITILGIFAAIIIAFVGGITFSSSVLENIDKVSVYKLVLVIDILAFVLTNSLYLLIGFIGKINNKAVDKKPLRLLNLSFVVILVCVIFAWFFDASALAEFHQRSFKWTKPIEPTSIPELTTENIKAFISLIFS